MVVLNVGVLCAVVQDVPPFQEISTHIFGALVVLLTRASKRTSMPRIVTPAGSTGGTNP